MRLFIYTSIFLFLLIINLQISECQNKKSKFIESSDNNNQKTKDKYSVTDRKYRRQTDEICHKKTCQHDDGSDEEEITGKKWRKNRHVDDDDSVEDIRTIAKKKLAMLMKNQNGDNSRKKPSTKIATFQKNTKTKIEDSDEESEERSQTDDDEDTSEDSNEDDVKIPLKKHVTYVKKFAHEKENKKIKEVKKPSKDDDSSEEEAHPKRPRHLYDDDDD